MTIAIEDYNPQWPIFFEEEAQRIKSVLEDKVVAIHHIGSTSVPMLAAKPIIDIVLVTHDLNAVKTALTSEKLGYRYKGEYNLPLRDLYGKEDKFKINLHVHPINSPEIDLNLMFRDYLRNNSEARYQYEAIKRAASQEVDATEKVETGITRYNLAKNDLITSILRQAGFAGLCIRFATQPAELDSFNKAKSRFMSDIDEAEDSRKIVLYEGTEIVGAAEVSHHSDGQFVINFAQTCDDPRLLRKFSEIIERWIRIRTNA